MVLLHSSFRVMNDGQRAQAQKVHLQKAKFFDLGHVELGHRQAVVGGQRQIVVRRLRGNDDTRRMGGSMAGHALHLQGRVDQLCDLRVVSYIRLSSGDTSNARFSVIFSSMGTCFATTSTC